MADIGEPKREIEIIPIPSPVEEPVPEKKKELVPA